LPESEEEEGRCEPETGLGSESLKTERLGAIAFSEVKLSAETEDGKVRRNEEKRRNGSEGYSLASRGNRVWTEGIASLCLSFLLPVELIIIIIIDFFFFFIRGWLIFESRDWMGENSGES
jgi:hypothetical protein